MAGRLKHMERSHRSHRNSKHAGIYAGFHRHAYTVKTLKESKMTLGQKLGRFVKKALGK